MSEEGEEERGIESVHYNLDAEHEEIEKEIATQLSALGFDVIMEAPVQNWIVDILAKKNGKVYAIEVGQNKAYKLPNLALFVDSVYHAPRGRQHPTKITMNHVLDAFSEEVEEGVKRLVVMAPKLQAFTNKPQKIVIEIHPSGKYEWGFFDE